MKKIAYLIHTEYHLLLSINDIMNRYSDTSLYEIQIIVKRSSKNSRLRQDLDFSFLPYNIKIVDFTIDLKSKLIPSEKHVLEELIAMTFDTLVFFQEQDPITIILINEYKKKGTKIHLYQDGLKPYIAHTMSFSPSLVLNNIRQNLWIKKNGHTVPDYFSFINCKYYAFLKGIDELYLTFPDAYINWNRLPLSTITPDFSPQFVDLLKKIFNWQEDLLEERSRVIFFMNQPMHDDGSFEVGILKQLENKYPDTTIYIKNHPLTSQVKLKAYAELKRVKIIDSKIPAELFISQLNDSIVFSLCSTSMFINNPTCKFYYTFAIKENNTIERLKKYKVINPSKHIMSVNHVDAIEF